MNRAVRLSIPCLVGIALVMLIQAAFIHPGVPAAVTISRSSAIRPVEHYLAALDHFLATGDDLELRAAVAAGFANWSSGDPAPSDYTGLVAQFATLRDLFPGLTLEHTVLDVDETVATVQIHPSTAGSASVAGLAIAPEALFGDIELLRFERGYLAERWSFPPLRGTFAVLTPLDAGSPKGAALTRLTVGKNAADEVTLGPASAALFVEQGAVRLHVEPAEGEAGAWWSPSGGRGTYTTSETLDLPAGSIVQLREGVRSYLWAQPGTLGTVVVVSLQMVDFASSLPERKVGLPLGKPVDPQGPTALSGFPSGVQIGRLHLQQGAEVRLDPTSRETLVLLESGALQAESPAGVLTELPVGQGIWSRPKDALVFRVTSAAGADLFLLAFGRV